MVVELAAVDNVTWRWDVEAEKKKKTAVKVLQNSRNNPAEKWQGSAKLSVVEIKVMGGELGKDDFRDTEEKNILRRTFVLEVMHLKDEVW